MGLLLDLIRREFATRPRRRFFYWRRFGLISLFLIWLVYSYLFGLMWGGRGTPGLALFSSLTKVTVLAVVLIAPFIAGELLMREKEERTLGLLFLTAVTPGQFLLAKLLTALLTSGALALGVLPLFVLSVSLGGIATEQILLAFLLLGSTIFAATGLGLWAGTRARSDQGMGSLLVGVMLVVGVALPEVFAFIYTDTQWLTVLKFWPEDRWLAVLSPYLAMTQIAAGVDLRGPRWACFSGLAFGLPFLALAARALPRHLAEEPSATGTLLARWRGRRTVRLHDRCARPTGRPVLWWDPHFVHVSPRRLWGGFLLLAVVIALLFLLVPLTTRPTLDLQGLGLAYCRTMVCLSAVAGGLVLVGRCPRVRGNPVLWRDYYFLYGGPRRIWGGFLVVATVAGLLWLAVLLIVQSTVDLQDFGRNWFWTLVWLSVVLGGLGFVGSHARCLSAERPGRVLDLLLTTDLEAAEILGGKQWAIFYAIVPWLLMALTGVAVSVWHKLQWWDAWEILLRFVMVCFPAVTGFGFAAIGLYCALRMPRSATVATLGALLVGVTLQLAAAMLPVVLARSLFTGGLPAYVDALVAFGIAIALLLPPLVLGVVLRRYLYRRLRTLATTAPP